MKISRMSKKISSIVLVVLMLAGILSAGFVASAADTLTGTFNTTSKAVHVDAATGIQTGGGGMYVWDGDKRSSISDSTKFADAAGLGGVLVFGWGTNGLLSWNSSFNTGAKDFTFSAATGSAVTVATFDPWGALKAVGLLGQAAPPVSILDFADADRTGQTVQAAVEDGSINFKYSTTAASATWTIESAGSTGAVLETIAGEPTGIKVKYTSVGQIVLKAANAEGGSAQVTINVHANNLKLDAYAYAVGAAKLTEGQTLTLEKGSTLEVSVDCTDPSKLTVSKTGTSCSFTQDTIDSVPVIIAAGDSVGITTFTLSMYGKTASFKINVVEPTVAKFFVGGVNIGGFTFVNVAQSKDVACNMDVDHWGLAVPSSGLTVAKKDGKTCTITGVTLGTNAVVNAYNASNAVIGHFSVFVGELYTDILLSTGNDPIANYSMQVNATQVFEIDCSVIPGSTTVQWELVTESGTGTVTNATLTTATNDANGFPQATVKALAPGVFKLKATANGLSNYVTITVTSDVTMNWYLNTVQITNGIATLTSASELYNFVARTSYDMDPTSMDFSAGVSAGLITIQGSGAGFVQVKAVANGQFEAKARYNNIDFPITVKIAIPSSYTDVVFKVLSSKVSKNLVVSEIRSSATNGLITPVLVGGKTMIPLRCLATVFGATNIVWNSTLGPQGGAEIEINGLTLSMPAGEMYFDRKNNSTGVTERIVITAGNPPVQFCTANDIYIPLRSVTEATGYKVDWQGQFWDEPSQSYLGYACITTNQNAVAGDAYFQKMYNDSKNLF